MRKGKWFVPSNRFSAEEVKQIRRDYVFGSLSVVKLAKKYKSTPATIRKVLKKEKTYDES